MNIRWNESFIITIITPPYCTKTKNSQISICQCPYKCIMVLNGTQYKNNRCYLLEWDAMEIQNNYFYMNVKCLVFFSYLKDYRTSLIDESRSITLNRLRSVWIQELSFKNFTKTHNLYIICLIVSTEYGFSSSFSPFFSFWKFKHRLNKNRLEKCHFKQYLPWNRKDFYPPFQIRCTNGHCN